MKTKNIYIRSKIGLFVGLLSLHTLSSCVNRGQQLGMMKTNYQPVSTSENNKKIEIPEQLLDLLNQYKPPTKKRWYKSPYCFIGGGVATMGISALACGLYYYLYLSSLASHPEGNPGVPPIGNQTVSIETAIAAVGTVANTTLTTIGTAATTAATVLTTALPTAGLIAATLRPNGLNPSTTSSSVAIPTSSTSTEDPTAMPSEVPTKSDNNASPMLSKKVIDYISENDFSIDSIEHCLNEDPSIINALHPEHGVNLLHSLIDKKNLKAIKFVVEWRGVDKSGKEWKADVNLPDSEGYTPLMKVPCNTPNSQAIYDYLLNNGADACKLNKRKQRLDSKPGIQLCGSEQLLEAFKKCR